MQILLEDKKSVRTATLIKAEEKPCYRSQIDEVYQQ
jgi:hypothetical protein